MRSKANSRAEGVSKGYRLRPETHSLVVKVQNKINGTKDEVISRACKMFYQTIINSNQNRSNKRNKQ